MYSHAFFGTKSIMPEILELCPKHVGILQVQNYCHIIATVRATHRIHIFRPSHAPIILIRNRLYKMKYQTFLHKGSCLLENLDIPKNVFYWISKARAQNMQD